MTSATNHRNAFTLIELLIVIAIIALLAAILFPVFNRARENARRASCQSNLKQIGLGIMQYTQDYDERYPMMYSNTPGGTLAVPSWRQTIQPYINSAQVFRCPSNTQNTTVDDAARDSYPAINRSYSGNIRVFSYRQTWSDPAPITLSFIAKPAQKIMVGERKDVTVVNAAFIWPDYNNSSKEAEVKSISFVGHLSTANYLFCDGHVKAMRPTQTMSDINMWGDFYDTSGTDCPSSADGSFLGINCDIISNGFKTNLAAVEAASS